MSSTGEPLTPSAAKQTERSAQRQQEDDEYTSVIVKRNDEAKVHPDDILERAIDEGLEQLTRPALSLFLSSIAAGLILGFSAMAVAVVYTAIPSSVSPLIQRVAAAFFYPLGFIICIVSGTQLFTEHTATAVYPILDRRKNAVVLLRLWAIVIMGNLLGAVTSAWLLTSAASVVSANEGFIEIGEHLVGVSAGTLLVSSVLAGWLMAQGAWLVLASSSRGSQICGIYIVTFLIGVGGLHHSIAGSVELFAAMMANANIGLLEAGTFIGTSLTGNMLGGSIFVATLNYAHIRETQGVT